MSGFRFPGDKINTKGLVIRISDNSKRKPSGFGGKEERRRSHEDQYRREEPVRERRHRDDYYDPRSQRDPSPPSRRPVEHQTFLHDPAPVPHKYSERDYLNPPMHQTSSLPLVSNEAAITSLLSSFVASHQPQGYASRSSHFGDQFESLCSAFDNNIFPIPKQATNSVYVEGIPYGTSEREVARKSYLIFQTSFDLSPASNELD